MGKKYLKLIVILFGLLILFILRPKKEEVVMKTRQEILKVEKEKKLQQDLKEAKQELEETIKRNKIIIKEREEREVEEAKTLEIIKNEILNETDEIKKVKKVDDLLDEIDRYRYSRKFSIPTLVELKNKVSKDETKKINERLYNLYRSTDEFDKAEKIKRELDGGGDIYGEEEDEIL
ncbi:MAG TPA: hypothetical protein DCR90_00490 [Fusobacteriaceae bacterium]|nr:hypothetical protein [Fusobacteriaceae bacterium]